MAAGKEPQRPKTAVPRAMVIGPSIHAAEVGEIYAIYPGDLNGNIHMWKVREADRSQYQAEQKMDIVQPMPSLDQANRRARCIMLQLCWTINLDGLQEGVNMMWKEIVNILQI